MSNRKTIGLRPTRPTATVDADKWVEGRTIELATEEAVKMKTSLDRKVVVGDYVMLDAAIHPPPKHQQVLCGSIRYGTTIKGVFNPAHHDCWLPMPKFPESVKERYRQEVENGKT